MSLFIERKASDVRKKPVATSSLARILHVQEGEANSLRERRNATGKKLDVAACWGRRVKIARFHNRLRTCLLASHNSETNEAGVRKR